MRATQGMRAAGAVVPADGGGAGGRAVARAGAAGAVVLAFALALAGCGGGVAPDAPIVRTAAAHAHTGSPTDSGSATDSGPYADLTAAQLMRRSEDAMRTLPAVTVHLKGLSSGVRMDVTAVMTSSDRCALDLVEGEDHVKVIGIGGATYIKAAADFWRSHGGTQGALIGAALGGKWLRMDEAAAKTGFGPMCSVDGLMDTASTGDSKGVFRKGGTASVDGRPVVTLVHTATQLRSTLSIAASGQPYILKVVKVKQGQTVTTTFSGFGAVPHISAPPAAQTLDAGSVGVPNVSV